MQIRRFFARDMRSALADVSRELGPDAAILSSRRIADGVELLAAVDYDPSVLTGAASRPVEPDEAPAVEPARARAASSQAASFEDVAAEWFARSGVEPMPAAPKANSKRDTASSSPVREAGKTSNRPLSDRNGFDRNEFAAEMATERKATSSRIKAEPVEPQPSSVSDSRSSPDLRDLKEEVSQLRGLMQEQLQGLAWRELKQRQPLRALLTKRLAMLELSPSVREQYAGASGRDAEQALANALAGIAGDVVNSEDPMLDRGGIYAFVGATGVGKTTSIAKLAARFALQHGPGNVALVSTDSYRIAGHDQLATYARLIGCAVRHADSKASLQDALDSFGDRRLILIDTAGMSQRDSRLAEQLAALRSSRYPIHQVLVLSATAQRGILQESVKQFSQRPLFGAILTKLDETTSLGPVLSVLLASRLPLMASCDGQRVPEDLRSLRGAQLVDRALKLAEQFHDRTDEWQLAHDALVPTTKAVAHART
jgi:flagellar biosynthesis protein FlhF